MLKKTITYTDYNGVVRTEDFFFNISKAELVEMEVSEINGLGDTLKAIAEANDGKQIIAHFKKIVLDAYGEKSPDGRAFVKSDEIKTHFSQTEAYSVLFMELATQADSATAFINGILPSNMDELIASVEAQNALPVPTSLPGTLPEAPLAPAPTYPTLVEDAKPVREMTREELLAALNKTNPQE